MYVIFIHGPVASGKRTIGARLAERTGLPLFHNHLTVDLARTLFGLFTEPFCRLRASIWRAAFAEAARAGQPFIFTFNPEASVDPALVDELTRIITDRGGRVHMVELRCARAEILRRLPNADRANKLNDPRVYEEVEQRGGFAFPPMPPATVTIETDTMAPDEAVAAIMAGVPGIRPC